MRAFLFVLALFPTAVFSDERQWGALECEVIETALTEAKESLRTAADRSRQLETALRGTDYATFQRIQKTLPKVIEPTRSMELLGLLIEQNCGN